MNIKYFKVFIFFELLVLSLLHADVSIINNVTKAVAGLGETNSYFIELSAPPGDGVTDVSVSIPLPSGATFTSSLGDGIYTPGTGVWTVSGAPLTSAQLRINFNHESIFTTQLLQTTASITSITPGIVSGVGSSSIAETIVGNTIIDWSQVTINGGVPIIFDNTTYTEDLSSQGLDVTVVGEDFGLGETRLLQGVSSIVGPFLTLNARNKPSQDVIDVYGNILTLFPSDRSEARIYFNTSSYPNGVSDVAFTIYDYDMETYGRFIEGSILFGVDAYGNEIYPEAIRTSNTVVNEFSETPLVHLGTEVDTLTSDPRARVTFVFGKEPISGVILKFWNEGPPFTTLSRAIRFSNFIIPGDVFVKSNSTLFYEIIAPTTEACLSNLIS